ARGAAATHAACGAAASDTFAGSTRDAAADRRPTAHGQPAAAVRSCPARRPATAALSAHPSVAALNGPAWRAAALGTASLWPEAEGRAPRRPSVDVDGVRGATANHETHHTGRRHDRQGSGRQARGQGQGRPEETARSPDD